MFEVYQYPTSLVLHDCRGTEIGEKLRLSVEVRDPSLITIEKIDDIPSDSSGKSLTVDLIYGIYNLLSGPHLAMITKSKKVGNGPGGEKLFRALEMKVIPVCRSSSSGLSKSEAKDEARYVKMLESVVSGNGKPFYYSMEYPLAMAQQRRYWKINNNNSSNGTGSSKIKSTSTSNLPLWQLSEERFMWNFKPMSDFIQMGLHQWIVPVINGFVSVQDNCTIEVSPTDKKEFSFIFITRRSAHRVGTRFCVRGADKHGNVANFAETEMIVASTTGEVSSFVQIRGSIPLYWDQVVTLKYMPRTRYAYSGSESVLDWNELAFNRHFTSEIDRYGGRVTVVNLIDKTGSSKTVRDQNQLGSAFNKYAKRYPCDAPNDLRYVWFDFHHECRKLQWHNLSKLMTIVEEEFKTQGCFKRSGSGTVISTQAGVFRTNCMDNLDRTNVVQSLIGRRSLFMALGIPEASSHVLDSPYKSFEHSFKNIWADNADAVSIMYAGTGALKTDFTRTGKRTIVGALADGKNSVVRYYLNNFHDGVRQDSYDLFVMNYVPDLRCPSPFSFYQSHCLVSFFLSLVPAVLVLSILLSSVLSNGVLSNGVSTFVQCYVALLFLMIFFIGKKGKFSAVGRSFVCKPAFCPTGYPEY